MAFHEKLEEKRAKLSILSLDQQLEDQMGNKTTTSLWQQGHITITHFFPIFGNLISKVV